MLVWLLNSPTFSVSGAIFKPFSGFTIATSIVFGICFTGVFVGYIDSLFIDESVLDVLPFSKLGVAF